MKLLYYSIIVILIFSTSLYLKPIQADATNGIEIKNIRTLPPTIIIGQTFKISTTLVNHSSQPIFVDYGSCEAPFSVTFDTHVLVNETHPICNLSILQQKLNPGENTTATSPSLDLVYRAINNGTTNATITFPYEIWNQTSQSKNNEIVSKSFSFTIYGKTPVPTLSQSDNQAIIDVALAIPGLQKWSNDWQFVSMGFMTAKNQPGNWQYATVNLKASSSSSLIPCDNNNEDWSAWVMIDRTTMKVIQATYPTLESHNCNYTTGGGPASYGGTIPNMDTPLKQFKSGIAAKDVKCNEGLELLMKSHDNMPACVKSTSIQRLLGQGWINPYNFNGENIGKESVSLSAYQGVSNEAFYNNGTVASNFTIGVNINNFKPSNASLVLQVYYNDGILYKTVRVSSDLIQLDGFYKYHLIAVSDKNHPPPFKVVATYNNETAIAYAPVFAHP